MDNTSAIAIGLTVGIFVLVLVSLLLFFKLRKRRRTVMPLGAPPPLHKCQSKSATSSSSSLRTPTPILQKSFSDSSEKLKTQKKADGRRSQERLEIQAESMTIAPTQKVSSRLTPSDSPGPPIGDQSPRSSQDLQRRDVVTPTSPHKPQIHQPQPQHPQVMIEVDPTTEEVPPYSYFVQRQPPIPLSDSPSPPPSPARSRSLDRPGYAPNEDNPGPYPPAQPAQRRGLSRSSRQRSPRTRGGRSSSSNS